jgi:branched-chain amino acid transport system permease protein
MLFASYDVYSIMIAVLTLGVALTVDLIAGRLGLFLLAQGAFMGIGGYVGALLMLHAGFDIVEACAVGGLAATAVGFLAALPTLRVRDEYLIVVGLGLQIVASEVFSNWPALGGVDGLTGIPGPFNSTNEWVILAGAVVLLAIVAVVYCLICMGPMGRTVAMIREDDIGAASLGRNVVAVKVGIIAVSSGLVGAIGVYFVAIQQYASPADFDVSQTILFLTIVFVGGMRSPAGIVIATAVLVGIQQYLAEVSSGATASTLEQAGFGVLLVVIVIAAPRGLGGGLHWARGWAAKAIHRDDGQTRIGRGGELPVGGMGKGDEA